MNTLIHTRSLQAAATGVLLAALSLAGCAATGGPTDEFSHDGLQKVRYTGLDEAWVRPDTDLSGYTKLMIRDSEIEYRAVRDRRVGPARDSEFPLTDSQKARLQDIFQDTLREELGKSRRLELTDTPGPDVLRIDAKLLDVVSRVPPDRGGARSDVYISSVGEATVQIELRDAESGEILARSVDRREAAHRRDPYRLERSAAPLNWAQVQREARRTAAQIRDYVETLHRGG